MTYSFYDATQARQESNSTEADSGPQRLRRAQTVEEFSQIPPIRPSAGATHTDPHATAADSHKLPGATTGTTGSLESFNALLREVSGTQRPKPQFEIIPHADAPLFSQADAGERMAGLVDVLALGTDSDMIKDLMRQAGLVCLWFFGKFIASYANPFDQLNDDLHLDMCNFRQSLLTPGSRGAMYIPRGHYKSSIVTELATAWELLRNPDLRVRITGATASKAEGFMHSVKAIFQHNDLVRALYPQACPRSNAPRWNDSEIVMPNRSRYYREASVEAGGIGGASEGHHYDLHIVDDMIGLGDLNALNQSGTTMQQAKKWFWGSEDTLLVSMRHSRVIVVGTRYAVDDVYGDIVREAHEVVGHPMKGFEPNTGGKWKVYYRKGVENGEVIFPENFSLELYAKMAQTSWWTFVTQYLNDPTQAGLAEFSTYTMPRCWLDYDDMQQRWFLMWDQGHDFLAREPLEAFDLVMAVDPAASERYVSAATSKSAVCVLATRHDGKKFILDVRAGFVKSTQMFDWMFELAWKYRGILRQTYLEANAGFKLLGPIVHEEEMRRGIWLNLQAAPAFGDKNARIRVNLQPELEMRRLYVCEAYAAEVESEQKLFPQSLRKDILDCLSHAVARSVTPEAPEVLAEAKVREEMHRYRGSSCVGY